MFFAAPEDVTRPDTTNWRREVMRGKLTVARSQERLAYDQVMGKLKGDHCGEVRVWQVEPERWVRGRPYRLRLEPYRPG